MKKVLLKGQVLFVFGDGGQARFALRSLRSRDDLFDIYLLNIPWGRTGHISEQSEEAEFINFTLMKTSQFIKHGGRFDISIQVTVPNEFEKIATTDIGYTAGIETNRVSPQWIQKTNDCVDKLIVVSEHSKKTFLETKYTIQNNQTGDTVDNWGLNVPVDVVNYPVRLSDPEPLDIDITTNNNFLVVSQWGVRKNLENTIRWFVQQFEDDEDVGLIVKTNTASDSIMDREFTAARLTALLGENPNRKCKVYLVHGELSPSQLTWLYQHETMKALINIGHGEGFGLPLFEAAYNGLPLITVPWSGQMDFICKPNKKGKKYPRVARVDFDIKQVQPEAVWDGVVQKDSMWAYAKEQSYKRVLKDVLEKQTHYRKEAEALKNYILEEFTEEKIYASFVNAVYNVTPEEESWLSCLNEIEIT